MYTKKKMRYLNFNIIQLVDKGKLKLQYRDNINLSRMEYSTHQEKVKTYKNRLIKD